MRLPPVCRTQGRTPLNIALRLGGSFDVVKILLENQPAHKHAMVHTSSLSSFEQAHGSTPGRVAPEPEPEDEDEAEPFDACRK